VTAAEARVPGAGVPLTAGLRTTVEPVSTFEVRTSVPVRGARLVLFDAQDAMVPSASDIEVGAESRFTLVPEEPLRPGSAYVLRREGISGRLVPADGGRSFEPATFPLETSGSPPQRSPPRQAKKRRGT
jgi:hypothetical protein